MEWQVRGGKFEIKKNNFILKNDPGLGAQDGFEF